MPCSDPPVLCNENDVCCYHDTDPQQDHCGQLGQCGASYIELRCNDVSDCPVEAPVCCAKDDELDNVIEIIACQPTCSAVTEYMLCELPTDCRAGCASVFSQDYEGYDRCVPE